MILAAVLSVLFVTVYGQSRYFDERAAFTMHNFYPELINPGAYGFDDDHEVMLNYRNAWAGFDGSPSTINLAYDGMLVDRLGLGIQVLNDNYGALATTKGLVGTSYNIASPMNKVSFGISAEYIQHKVKSGDLLPGDLSDPKVQEALDGAQFFDISLGAYGKYDNKITYGLSFPSVASIMISDLDKETSRNFGLIGQVGYDFMVENYGFVLTPMITVKALNNTPLHTDINLNGRFLDDKLIGGLGYTVGGENRVSFLLGTNVGGLSLYYSYNASNHEFQTYNNGSHEFTIGYTFMPTVRMEEPVILEEDSDF